jgi:hypothetical protein
MFQEQNARMLADGEVAGDTKAVLEVSVNHQVPEAHPVAARPGADRVVIKRYLK